MTQCGDTDEADRQPSFQRFHGGLTNRVEKAPGCGVIGKKPCPTVLIRRQDLHRCSRPVGNDFHTHGHQRLFALYKASRGAPSPGYDGHAVAIGEVCMPIALEHCDRRHSIASGLP